MPVGGAGRANVDVDAAAFGWAEWLAATVAASAAAATVAAPTTLASTAAQVRVVILRKPWSRTETAAHAGIRRFRVGAMRISLRGELLKLRSNRRRARVAFEAASRL